MLKFKVKNKDTWGVICSGLCLIHCLATPLLIAGGSLGVLGILLTNEWVHQLMLVPVVLFSVLSFPSAYKKHRHHMPGLLAIIGVFGLILAVTYGHDFETVLTAIGASILMVAHGWNWHLTKKLVSNVRQKYTTNFADH